MMKSPLKENAGKQRLKADVRQLGGAILALGICAMFGSLAGVASIVGRDGGTPSEHGIPLWSLIGFCCQAFFGAISIVVGYMALIADTGVRRLTRFLCLSIQLAWIPYITSIVAIGKQTVNTKAQLFIPQDLNPSDSHVHFVGAIGILAVLAYGFAYIGSLAFVSFSLLVYQSDKAHIRTSSYYRGRLFVYSLAVCLAGLTQLALGCFILETYGNGPLDQAINVAVYTIFFPEISVSVGLVQLLVGAGGVFKYCGHDVLGYKSSRLYQLMCFLMWILMMILQLMVQIAYAPGGTYAAAAPTRACVYFGLAFMPAYLEHKMRTTPDEIDVEYYGTSNETAQFDIEEFDIDIDIEQLTEELE